MLLRLAVFIDSIRHLISVSNKEELLYKAASSFKTQSLQYFYLFCNIFAVCILKNIAPHTNVTQPILGETVIEKMLKTGIPFV